MVAVGLDVSSEMSNGAVALQSVDCDRRTRATPAFFTQARTLAHGRLRLPIDSFEFLAQLYKFYFTVPLQDKPPTHPLSQAFLLIKKKTKGTTVNKNRSIEQPCGNIKIISEEVNN